MYNLYYWEAIRVYPGNSSLVCILVSCILACMVSAAATIVLQCAAAQLTWAVIGQ